MKSKLNNKISQDRKRQQCANLLEYERSPRLTFRIATQKADFILIRSKSNDQCGLMYEDLLHNSIVNE